MKKMMVIIAMVLCVSSVWAALINDNFNRTDTSYSTSGTTIGANWVNSMGTDTWKVSNSNLFVNSVSSPTHAILYNNALSTVSGGGTNFTLKADVSAGVANGWAGITFNYQNPTNYYQLRIKGNSSAYQLISVVNGANGTVMVNKTDATTTFAVGTLYSLTVTSSDAYNFGFTITEVGSSTVLNLTTTAVDPNSLFAGGYAGLYTPTSNAADPDAKFDNFSLQVIPEPATIGMLGLGAVAVFLIRRRFA